MLDPGRPEFNVGDLVWVTVAGLDMFKRPVRILSMQKHDDGSLWAFVEGAAAAVPLECLTAAPTDAGTAQDGTAKAQQEQAGDPDAATDVPGCGRAEMSKRAIPEFDPAFAGPAEWAAMYRACGLQVIPCYRPGEGKGAWKRPLLAQWAPLQHELVSQATYDHWYGPNGEHATRHNMGILTGPCSGNVFVLDLDVHKNPAALPWWLGVIELENSRLEPETVQQCTGGGGRQLLFRAPPGYTIPTRKTEIGVDVRGQGGFAVMPPSRHESGRDYNWLPGCAPWEIEIAIAPPWLLEAIEALVDAYGGDEAAPARERTASPGGDYDAFGNRIDGREQEMRNVVWHAVLELYRQSPDRPHKDMWQAKAEQAYEIYERRVTTRIEHVAKREGLEREGRGPTEFWKKWRREMRHWGSPKMAAAAARPNPKAEAGNTAGPGNAAAAGVDPVDLWAKFDPPPLPRGLLPKVIEDFAFERGRIMGADEAGFAVGALVACAASIPEDIKLQPKRHDTEWQEAARLWGALVGSVSGMKSPMLDAVAKEVRRIDTKMARAYQEALGEWLRLPKEEQKKTPRPKQLRARIMDTTVEASQEILTRQPRMACSWTRTSCQGGSGRWTSIRVCGGRRRTGRSGCRPTMAAPIPSTALRAEPCSFLTFQYRSWRSSSPNQFASLPIQARTTGCCSGSS